MRSKSCFKARLTTKIIFWRIRERENKVCKSLQTPDSACSDTCGYCGVRVTATRTCANLKYCSYVSCSSSLPKYYISPVPDRSEDTAIIYTFSAAFPSDTRSVHRRCARSREREHDQWYCQETKRLPESKQHSKLRSQAHFTIIAGNGKVFDQQQEERRDRLEKGEVMNRYSFQHLLCRIRQGSTRNRVWMRSRNSSHGREDSSVLGMTSNDISPLFLYSYLCLASTDIFDLSIFTITVFTRTQLYIRFFLGSVIICWDCNIRMFGLWGR